MKAYKFLADGRTGPFSDFAWPPAGEWVTADGPVVDCVRGIHALPFEEILDWIDNELWEVELDGEIAGRDGMLIAERGRLVRRIAGWDTAVAQTFAETCARRVAALAAAALRRLGLDDEARRLEEARDVSGIRTAALAALDKVQDDATTELVSFAGDLFALAAGQRPDAWRMPGATTPAQPWGVIAANAAFVTAHVAGRASVLETGSEAAYASGYEGERIVQLAWFRSLLPAD